MMSFFFFIKKKNEKLQLVINYSQLNKITIKNKYPLPIIQELLDQLKDTKFLLLMNIDTGFNNVQIAKKTLQESSIPNKSRNV